MIQKFINYNLIKSFSADAFKSKAPFPWFDFHQFLTPECFQELYQDFPSLDMFEKHVGIERNHGQRSHNRYYLAYEKSVYQNIKHKNRGVVESINLTKNWQEFIEELSTSMEYRNFIESLFGISEYKMRYAWHVGVNYSEVSPHVDGDNKIGTHIFYFNTKRDWDPSWGGSLLVLSNKLINTMNPDFVDFASTIPTQMIDNHSFLFKNTPDAWHGVKPLNCPEGAYRRLFNVVFEFPERSRKPFWQSSLLSPMKVLVKSA